MPQPNAWLADVPVYTPGRHHVAPGLTPAVLSANENPLGPGARARQAIDHALAQDDTIKRYPHDDNPDLIAQIARVHQLPPDSINVGHGSDALITLITHCYAAPGRAVLYSEHGFLMYPINARSVGAQPVPVPERDLKVDVEAMLAALTPQCTLMFLANPNNPTGSYIDKDALTHLIDGLPEHVLLVVDEAYAEYVTAHDYASALPWTQTRENVVVVRTFSKLHALAGLRLGWSASPPAVAQVLRRQTNPFNVSAIAAAAGAAAIGDEAHLRRSVAHNTALREDFTQFAQQLGFPCPPSVCNFTLTAFASPDEASACAQFLESRGILVRSVAGYGLPSYLRITIGLKEEHERLKTALHDFRERTP